MQRTDEAHHIRMRRILTVVALVASVVACNALLTFVFVPYGSKSEVAWTDYATTEDIDCVVVGTSTSMRAFDPDVLDKNLGTHSFNLSTPSQLLDESYVAVRTAYEDHGITRVILGLSHAQLIRSAKPNPGSPFMYERSRVVSAAQHLEGLSYLLFDGDAISSPSSLNMAFPWASGMVKSAQGIANNVRMKMDGTSLYEASKASEPGLAYEGRGFYSNGRQLDYNSSEAQSFFAQERRDDIGVDQSNSADIDPARARVLTDLCDYCEQHDIELVVIVPPLAEFSVIEYGDAYFDLGEKTAQLVQEHGGSYYDMNLARPELFDAREEFFSDSDHLNYDGAEAFSTAVCDLMHAVEQGKDTDVLFVDGEEEYLASIDHISCVFVDTATEADGIHIHTRAMAGSDVEVEYQFLELVDDEWQEIRGWDTDPDFTHLPEDGSRGKVILRVNARSVGSDAEYERYRMRTALY